MCAAQYRDFLPCALRGANNAEGTGTSVQGCDEEKDAVENAWYA